MKLTPRHVVWLVALCFACSSQEEELAEPQRQAVQEQVSSDQEASPSSPAVADSMESIWREQKLIRSAEMSVEVDEIEQATNQMEEITAKYDGLVIERETTQSRSGTRQANIRLRVPSSNFEVALVEFRRLGAVQREKLSTEDVTKAYADVERRLSAKKRTEERLRAILSSRTGNLAEILQAEVQLGRVTGEIEQLQGEQKYYQHRITTSTILISLSEKAAALSVLPPMREILEESLSTFGASLKLMTYLFVFFIPWLAIGIPAVWVLKKIARRRQTSSSQ